MSQTHQVDVGRHVVTKTYVDHSLGEHLREWNALQAISRARPDLTPRPLKLTPEPSIVMTVVPGRPLAGHLDRPQLDGMRRALADLWSIAPGDLRPIEHTAFIQGTLQAISAWQGAGLIADAHRAAAEWLANGEPEQLAVPVQPVIGHGDPNLANYLWDGSNIRIVDFEDAGASDLTIELANLVEHIASRRTDWTSFAQRFAVDTERFRAARRLFAIFWLTLLRPGGRSASRNPPGTSDAQARRVLNLLCAS